MSKRDVEDYFNKICNDYHELLETLHEMEDMAQQNIIGPELLENIEKMVAPVKQNYERWSYMMFLLNQPVNKKKHNWYKNTEGNKLNNISKENTLGSDLIENKETINKIKQEINK